MSSLRDRFAKAYEHAKGVLLLKAEAMALMDRIDSSEEIDIEYVNDMIGVLESTIIRRLWMYKFNISEEEVAVSLLPVVMQLKEFRFKRLDVPEIIQKKNGCASLCQYCDWALNQIDNGGPEVTRKSTFFDYIYLCAMDTTPDFPVLTGRSQAGCDLCCVVLNSFTADLDEDSKLLAEKASVWLKISWGQTTRAHGRIGNVIKAIRLLVWPLNRFPTFISFRLETTDERLREELGLTSPLAPTPLDPANIELVRSCLRTSDHSHADRFIPRRLLDLGTIQGTKPRVVEMRGRGSLNQSEALSYCWGPPDVARQQVILTSETRHRFLQGIAMDELTKVVQDACTVCRTFGLRYLWVDALCILQQDKADWEEQSYEMEMVFRNSSFTICTPASSTCLEGFLVRQAPLQIPIHLRCNLAQTEGTAYLIQSGSRIYGNHYTRFVRPLLADDLEFSRWNNRGWVFQEKVLSTRKIYFGTEMIHVQVNDTVTSETGFRKSHEDNPTRPSLYFKDYMTVTPKAIVELSPKDPVLWYDVIENFSRKNLSNKLDVFPAISGIAKMFQDVYKDDYVAGLWVRDLKCGLIFDTRFGSPGKSFSELLRFLSSETEYIGPSWSWASRPEFLNFTMCTNMRCRVRSHLREEFQLLDVQNNIDGSNPLGRINSASITLSGTVLDVPEIWNSFEIYAGDFYTFLLWHGVFLSPDWFDNNGYVTDEDRSKIRLLLISSCCAAPAESINKWLEGRDDHYREQKIEIISRPEYARSFAGDQDPAFNPATDCKLCTEDQARDAWGLMICPAGLPNKYYRVGYFVARAYFGGLSIFDNGRKEVVELV